MIEVVSKLSVQEHNAYKANMFEVVTRDLRHHLDGPLYENPLRITLIRLLRAILAPEFRLVLSYRIYAMLHTKGYRMFAYFLYLHSKRKYKCDISPEARIGAGLRIAHCSDIVIGPLVIIGNDVEIFNGVTLGNRLRRTDTNWKMPKVGNQVKIGTGAKLLGDIEIGDDCRIGANAVVLCSVQAGRSAVGIPAKVI